MSELDNSAAGGQGGDGERGGGRHRDRGPGGRAGGGPAADQEGRHNNNNNNNNSGNNGGSQQAGADSAGSLRAGVLTDNMDRSVRVRVNGKQQRLGLDFARRKMIIKYIMYSISMHYLHIHLLDR